MCPPLSDNQVRDCRKSLGGGHNDYLFAALTAVTYEVDDHQAVPNRRLRNAYSSQAAHKSRRS